LTNVKPYKSVEPFESIRQMRGILEELDLFTTEMPFPSSDGFYSHAVFIENDDLADLHIGSFGKGVNTKYSLASAYGEIIERLQNGVIFFRNFASLFHLRCAARKYLESGQNVGAAYKERLERENLALDFIFGPDEVYLSPEDAVESCYLTLRHLLGEDNPGELTVILKKKLGMEEILCVPFYNIGKKAIEYFPIELAYRTTVSNGMCAGNTYEEAILHGVCEVFERYAVKKIYTDELTPPTVPLEVFKGTRIFDRIMAMQQYNGLNIIIKDCSMGMGLPVMGVLVVNPQNHSYTFNLGGDPSPVTAVERCLTEMWQGGANIHFYPFDLSRDPFEPLADSDSQKSRTREQNKKKHFFQNLYQGRGAWPNSIFGDKPSYPFEGFPQGSCLSDKEDLAIMVDKVNQLGFEMLVRDVSYLGFPTFLVHIPGMSTGKFHYDRETLFALQEVERHIQTLIDIKNAPVEAVREFGEVVNRYDEKALPFTFDFRNFFLYAKTGGQLEGLDPDIFMTLVFMRVEEYANALKYMTKFLDKPKNNPQAVQPFHYCLRDYLKLKENGISIERIFKLLSQLHGENMVRQVLGQLAFPARVLAPFALPSCFNCENCPIAVGCKHFEILGIVKRLHEKCKKWDIDQKKHLEKIFE
jgi:ribosomal protein S12 methylthiotransferase accessory factor